MNQHPEFLPAYLALGLGCSDVVITSVLSCLPEDFKVGRKHWALVRLASGLRVTNNSVLKVESGDPLNSFLPVVRISSKYSNLDAAIYHSTQSQCRGYAETYGHNWYSGQREWSLIEVDLPDAELPKRIFQSFALVNCISRVERLLLRLGFVHTGQSQPTWLGPARLKMTLDLAYFSKAIYFTLEGGGGQIEYRAKRGTGAELDYSVNGSGVVERGADSQRWLSAIETRVRRVIGQPPGTVSRDASPTRK